MLHCQRQCPSCPLSCVNDCFIMLHCLLHLERIDNLAVHSAAVCQSKSLSNCCCKSEGSRKCFRASQSVMDFVTAPVRELKKPLLRKLERSRNRHYASQRAQETITVHVRELKESILRKLESSRNRYCANQRAQETVTTSTTLLIHYDDLCKY